MITRTQARRYAGYGWAAGLVLLVATGSLWALDLPGMDAMPPKPAPPAEPAVEQPKVPPTRAAIDADAVRGVAARIDLAVVKAPPKPTDPVLAANPKQDSAAPAAEWAYLGAIHEHNRSLAMISVDGRQKILAEGRTFGDTKLVSVADDKITIDLKGDTRSIDRASREGHPPVAWVRNMASNPPPANAGAGVPGTTIAGVLSQQARARLAARRLNADLNRQFRGGPGGGRDARGGTRGGRGRGGAG